MKNLDDYLVKDKAFKIILYSGLGLMILSPIVFTRFIKGFPDFTQTGQIGDTIGGLTAPIINSVAAILIYISFLAQQKANRLQYDGLKDEIKLNQQQSNYNLILELIKDFKEELTIKKIKIGGFGSVNSFLNTLSDLVEREDYSFILGFNSLFKNSLSDIRYLKEISLAIKNYVLSEEQKAILAFRLKNFIDLKLDDSLLPSLIRIVENIEDKPTSQYSVIDGNSIKTRIKNISEEMIEIIKQSRVILNDTLNTPIDS